MGKKSAPSIWSTDRLVALTANKLNDGLMSKVLLLEIHPILHASTLICLRFLEFSKCFRKLKTRFMRQSYKSNYKQVRFVSRFSFCFVLFCFAFVVFALHCRETSHGSEYRKVLKATISPK